MATQLTPASASASAPASAGIVARGSLQEFNVAAVLQALSISRQYTKVELFAANRVPAGRVFLKSGMVIRAEVPNPANGGAPGEGLHALEQLLSQPLQTFQVERLPPLERYPEPIGQLSTQLLSIRNSQRAAKRESAANPQPRPITVRKPPERPAQKTPFVAVASPKGGCGKTTVAINLAVALASAGRRTLLIDTDPNGDILSALASRQRAHMGIFDALSGQAEAQDIGFNTVVPGLRVIPAMGPAVASSLTDTLPDHGLWVDLFSRLAASFDVAVVDTPAGMFGLSRHILGGCSHVLGVLQAESIPKRSFIMFRRGLEAMGNAPQVVGVVVNMFRRSHQASLSALLDAESGLPDSWLLQTTIPRSDAFLEASDEGMPVAFSTSSSSLSVRLLFGSLAKEIQQRVGLSSTRGDVPSAFLL